MPKPQYTIEDFKSFDQLVQIPLVRWPRIFRTIPGVSEQAMPVKMTDFMASHLPKLYRDIVVQHEGDWYVIYKDENAVYTDWDLELMATLEPEAYKERLRASLEG